MDVTQEADVRAMALHLPPANIQNECFSERSHLMFCSYGTHGGITLSKTDGPGIEAAGSPNVRLLERSGRSIWRKIIREKGQVHPAECQDRIGWLYRTV